MAQTTGTLATVEAADAASVSGAIFVACAVAITEAADAVAIACAVPALAVLAVAEQGDGFAAGMFLTLMGTAAISEQPDAVAVTVYDFMFWSGAFVASVAGLIASVPSTIAPVRSVQSRPA